MRWFLRLTCAATLCVGFVAMLTAVAWPRPRFVVEMPAVGRWGDVSSQRSLRLDQSDRLSIPRPEEARTPWLGFSVTDEARQGDRLLRTRGDFWFVNLQDGRTVGPWNSNAVRLKEREKTRELALAALRQNPRDMAALQLLGEAVQDGKIVLLQHAWDHRGVAVVAGLSAPSSVGATAVGRYDPETEQYTTLATDRSDGFLLSSNGETLLTLPPDRPEEPGGEFDFVCFDLTADPPTRTRIAVAVPGHPLPAGDASNPIGVRCRTYALSPDGRTLAVGEVWSQQNLLSEEGVRLFDTRTGKLTATLTDYGPPLERGPTAPGAFGLAFSPDSQRLSLFRLPTASHTYPAAPSLHQFETLRHAGGGQRVLDVATGKYVPPPDRGYRPYRDQEPVNFLFRNDDGSLRLDLAGDPRTPDRFRVVDAGGTAMCEWRPLLTDAGRPRLGPAAQFVPGTTGVAWVGEDTRPLSPFTAWLRRQLRLPTPLPNHYVWWYDWATDDLTVIRNFGPIEPARDRLQLHVQPGRIALVTQTPTGGTVEVWDAPPPRRPWAWSVPAGVALGFMVTAAGTRLLGRRLDAGKPAAPGMSS